MKEDLFAYLRDLQIDAYTYEHEAVYTVEQAQKVCANIPGGHCKNLFLIDKFGQFWLVVVQSNTKINLKKLAQKVEAGRFSFAKEQNLLHILGVTVGSVTPFALINDKDAIVNVIIEERLFEHELLNFHPLVNSATTAITNKDFKKFLNSLKNRIEKFSTLF